MRPLRTLPVAILGTALLVAGCGNTVGDRAISGGAIGAAAGSAGAAATDNDIAGGALIGGLIGAGVGAATARDDRDDDYYDRRRYDDDYYDRRYEDDYDRRYPRY